MLTRQGPVSFLMIRLTRFRFCRTFSSGPTRFAIFGRSASCIILQALVFLFGSNFLLLWAQNFFIPGNSRRFSLVTAIPVPDQRQRDPGGMGNCVEIEPGQQIFFRMPVRIFMYRVYKNRRISF